jgi:hypothetical protein
MHMKLFVPLSQRRSSEGMEDCPVTIIAQPIAMEAYSDAVAVEVQPGALETKLGDVETRPKSEGSHWSVGGSI